MIIFRVFRGRIGLFRISSIIRMGMGCLLCKGRIVVLMFRMRGYKFMIKKTGKKRLL